MSIGQLEYLTESLKEIVQKERDSGNTNILAWDNLKINKEYNLLLDKLSNKEDEIIQLIENRCRPTKIKFIDKIYRQKYFDKISNEYEKDFEELDNQRDLLENKYLEIEKQKLIKARRKKKSSKKYAFISMDGFKNETDSHYFECFNSETEPQKIYDDMISKGLTETTRVYFGKTMKISIIETYDGDINLHSYKNQNGEIVDYYSVFYRER